MTRAPLILVVEDDESMADGLARILEREGWRTEIARDGAAALAAARDRRPDLVVLDVMLPRKDGWQVLRELRGRGAHLPILMLSAKGAESDKVLGLELGADDYVAKPFGVAELVARVRALLRRAAAPAARADRATFPGLDLDFARQRATGSAGTQELSTHENGVLRALVAHAGELVPRTLLLDQVWGDDAAVTARVVDFHVTRLRRKIELATGEDEPRRIITVHGSGYRFVP
ncbi:MAG TPA: response regulator transcription factor [Planctomycetota bacterium]|nr:response regulator transcription factor [Planctomycetota bacterium]